MPLFRPFSQNVRKLGLLWRLICVFIIKAFFEHPIYVTAFLHLNFVHRFFFYPDFFDTDFFLYTDFFLHCNYVYTDFFLHFSFFWSHFFTQNFLSNFSFDRFFLRTVFFLRCRSIDKCISGLHDYFLLQYREWPLANSAG